MNDYGDVRWLLLGALAVFFAGICVGALILAPKAGIDDLDEEEPDEHDGGSDDDLCAQLAKRRGVLRKVILAKRDEM